MKTKADNKAKSERGASLVEYALLVSLIAILTITATRNLGREIRDNYSDMGDAITAGDPGCVGGPNPPLWCPQ